MTAENIQTATPENPYRLKYEIFEALRKDGDIDCLTECTRKINEGSLIIV